MPPAHHFSSSTQSPAIPSFCTSIMRMQQRKKTPLQISTAAKALCGLRLRAQIKRHKLEIEVIVRKLFKKFPRYMPLPPPFTPHNRARWQRAGAGCCTANQGQKSTPKRIPGAEAATHSVAKDKNSARVCATDAIPVRGGANSAPADWPLDSPLPQHAHSAGLRPGMGHEKGRAIARPWMLGWDLRPCPSG